MTLINKMLLGVGLAIAGVAGIAFLYLIIVNAHLKTQLAQAQANSTACHIANDDFTAVAARQNAAIQQMKTQAAARAKKTAVAVAAARETARVYQRAEAALAARQPMPDGCASSEKLLDAYLKEQK